MNPPGKFRSLLATARIANVPSVVSNVWAGAALAVFANGGWDGTPSDWQRAGLLALAGVMLYLAGNFFNDWHDHEWDAIHRPERALPRELFPPMLYRHLGFAGAFGGILLAAFVHKHSGMAALAILAFIAIYTQWHKRSGWAVVPMGLCRALLPVMGWLAFRQTDEFTLVSVHAAGLLIYIAGLSLSARNESRKQTTKGSALVPRGMLVASGLIIAACWFPRSVMHALTGIAPFAIWLALCLTQFRKPVGAHVSALLAGIPLIDWVALLPLALLSVQPGFSLWSDPFTAVCVILPGLAFFTGRRLQRLAPAT